jgi:hypothetical protein
MSIKRSCQKPDRERGPHRGHSRFKENGRGTIKLDAEGRPSEASPLLTRGLLTHSSNHPKQSLTSSGIAFFRVL